MKATINTSIALATAFVLFSLHSSYAQRGRGNDHNRNDHNNGRTRWEYNDNQRGHHHEHDRRDHRDVYYHAPAPRPVYHHHHAPVTRVVYRPAPRYVYYSDYNVYYDCSRQVYIMPSGPRWIVSVNVPISMHGVDRGRVAYSDVDYYDDDFTMRLEHHDYEYGRRR